MTDKYRGVLGHFADILKQAGPEAKLSPASDAFDQGRRMGLHEAATWLLESLDLFEVLREEIGADWLTDQSFMS